MLCADLILGSECLSLVFELFFCDTAHGAQGCSTCWGKGIVDIRFGYCMIWGRFHAFGVSLLFAQGLNVRARRAGHG